MILSDNLVSSTSLSEFVEGQPESYYHGEGRVALTGSEPRFQYKLTDHLGNTMVLFEDKDDDKIITTESNPAENEVLQRNFYYAFGLPMQGPWNHAPADPDMPYLYNGKELEGELGLGWYAYGFRYYDASVGRFAGVDPISSQFPHVSVFNYAENKPINGVDLHGLQWVYFQHESTTTVNVNVNLTYNGSALTSSVFQIYLSAVNNQFRSTLEKSSSGFFTGAVSFKGSDEENRVVPSLLVLDQANQTGIAGATSLSAAVVSLHDSNGNLKTPETFALDVVHELLHTLKLDHPFEFIQSEDAQLIHEGGNRYLSGDKTDPNIMYNIMNYGSIFIDGQKLSELWQSKSGDMLTSGQLKFMLNEIRLQMSGAGVSSRADYWDYWLDSGERVQRVD